MERKADKCRYDGDHLDQCASEHNGRPCEHDPSSKDQKVSEHRYAQRWLVIDREPLNLLTAAEAERRHGTREEYVALIGDPDAPSQVVALAGPWVTVSFLDAERRAYLVYSFKELRPGHLFLSQAIHREFVDASSEPGSTMICAFAENGKIIMEHQNRRTGETDARRAMVDPTPNWDRYPTFGVYDDLLREERDPSGYRPVKLATKGRNAKRTQARPPTRRRR
jgi:hypothetical protein